MEYYIERNGQIDGPHSLDALKDLHTKGLLLPETYVAAAGDTDWRPFGELLQSLNPGGAPPPLPAVQAAPPLPAGGGYQNLDQPLRVDGRTISGTEGKTCRQIVEEVKQGGRFVIFQYAFSIVVMSFRRPGGVTYIPPGSSGAGKALGWSLISFFFGWWGIPWGIFYTISTIWRNTAGGVDVSEPVLAGIVGPVEANSIVQKRPALKTGALWGVRLALLASPVILFQGIISGGAAVSAAREAKLASVPGYVSFKKADDKLKTSSLSSAGNSPAATEAARGFATTMKKFILEASTSSNDSRHKDFHVWCEKHDKHCLFMVRVPDLRRYRDDAKNNIAHAAWMVAQTLDQSLLAQSGSKIAVALRGDYLYDRLLEGRFPMSITESESDTLPASVTVTKGSHVDEALAAYFVD